jgi:Spy/CpxP family protein refolding chaperone
MMGQSQRMATLVIGTALVAGLVGGAAFDRYVLLPRRVEAFRQQRNTRPSPDEMRKRFVDRMATDLSLSETQRTRLDSIYMRQTFVMDSITKVMRPVYDSVWKLSRAEVDSLLDPAQRAKLAELRKQRRGGRGGPGGGGPGGGGPGGGPRGGDSSSR